MANPTLSIGAKGVAVWDVQEALNRLASKLGFYPVAQDGVFGNETLEAVRRFQQSANLNPNGVVGAQTWAALDAQAKAVASVPLPPKSLSRFEVMTRYESRPPAAKPPAPPSSGTPMWKLALGAAGLGLLGYMGWKMLSGSKSESRSARRAATNLGRLLADVTPVAPPPPPLPESGRRNGPQRVARAPRAARPRVVQGEVVSKKSCARVPPATVLEDAEILSAED